MTLEFNFRINFMPLNMVSERGMVCKFATTYVTSKLSNLQMNCINVTLHLLSISEHFPTVVARDFLQIMNNSYMLGQSNIRIKHLFALITGETCIDMAIGLEFDMPF